MSKFKKFLKSIKMSKRIAIVCFAIVITAVFGMSTYAAYTNINTANNTLDVAKYDVRVESLNGGDVGQGDLPNDDRDTLYVDAAKANRENLPNDPTHGWVYQPNGMMYTYNASTEKAVMDFFGYFVYNTYKFKVVNYSDVAVSYSLKVRPHLASMTGSIYLGEVSSRVHYSIDNLIPIKSESNSENMTFQGSFYGNWVLEPGAYKEHTLTVYGDFTGIAVDWDGVIAIAATANQINPQNPATACSVLFMDRIARLYEDNSSYNWRYVDYGTVIPTDWLENNVADPVKPGYTFLGWYDGMTDTPADLTQVITSRKHFIAHWARNYYTVNVDYAGGSSNVDVPDTAKVEHGTTYASHNLLPTLTRAGYTFVGWQDDQGNTVTGATQIKRSTNGATITVTAKWEATA